MLNIIHKYIINIKHILYLKCGDIVRIFINNNYDTRSIPPTEIV